MTSRVRVGLVVVAVALSASLAACGSESADGDSRTDEDPLPTPAEAGAAALPAGASTSGLAATFATETWLDKDGAQCYLVYRLHPSGEAESDYRCADELPSIIGNDDSIVGDEEVGDYGHLDGRVWIRTVWRDEISGQPVLTEREAMYCDGELFFVPPANPSPSLRNDPFQLIDGDHPPEDGGDACPS